MGIDKPALIASLAEYDKSSLLIYLREVLDEMTEDQIENVFGELIYTESLYAMTPVEVIERIKVFYDDSIAGKYYAPFSINSKNYRRIPPETDAWFREISRWLDQSCKLAYAGESEAAAHGLAYCLELIDMMENGEDIVFAHEYGTWMINSKFDYKAIFEEVRDEV
ncbi:MAG: hypothetical protein SF053_20410 [Bacteroidia bacterium]|nr:hypothetical protein [Bacteroidia bacterium]